MRLACGCAIEETASGGNLRPLTSSAIATRSKRKVRWHQMAVKCLRLIGVILLLAELPCFGSNLHLGADGLDPTWILISSSLLRIPGQP